MITCGRGQVPQRREELGVEYDGPEGPTEQLEGPCCDEATEEVQFRPPRLARHKIVRGGERYDGDSPYREYHG